MTQQKKGFSLKKALYNFGSRFSKTTEDEMSDVTEKTIKQLFTFCGNQCAFPGCTQVMIDEQMEMDVIGVICHIEDANPGGRYNENMTPNERHGYDNLMLMCPTHHTITKNVTEYSVGRLKKMKVEHLAKVIEEKLICVINDDAVKQIVEKYEGKQYAKEINVKDGGIGSDIEVSGGGIGEEVYGSQKITVTNAGIGERIVVRGSGIGKRIIMICCEKCGVTLQGYIPGESKICPECKKKEM